MIFESIPGKSFGAIEQSGLQIDEATHEQQGIIKKNLHTFGLLIFKNQVLPPQSAVDFLEFMTGKLPLMTFQTTPMDARAKDLARPAHLPGFPMIRPIGNTKDSQGQPTALYCRTGYEWHKDADGEGLTLIVCIKTPRSGGNTLFCSAYDIYEALSADQKEWAHSMTVVTSNRFTAGGPSAVDCENGLRMDPSGTCLINEAHTRMPWWKLSESRWPLVRMHPVTGRYYFTTGGKNLDHLIVAEKSLTPEKSRAILSEFMLTGLRPQRLSPLDDDRLPTALTEFSTDFIFDHQWAEGDVVLWDNRACLHTTTPVVTYRHEDRLHYHLIQARTHT